MATARTVPECEAITAEGVAPRMSAMHRILLMLRNREDRRLLSEWLGNRYGVVAAESREALEERFDLCIIDGISLDAVGDSVRARKRSERNCFLPVLLVTP